MFAPVNTIEIKPVVSSAPRKQRPVTARPSGSASALAKRTPQRTARFIVSASTDSQETTALTGLVFQSSGELDKVPSTSEASLCRDRYSPACEAALNDQINVEYNVSYIYHSMYAYFGRDNVALPGLAKYFKEASDEERGHAEKLMEYQNHRGGKVVLQTLTPSTITEFEHADKGDALYAMEIALALEKLNNEKLLSLHQVAVDNDDPQMTDFIEGEFLEDQMKAIYEVSHMVSELRRIGKGHAVWDWDKHLEE